MNTVLSLSEKLRAARKSMRYVLPALCVASLILLSFPVLCRGEGKNNPVIHVRNGSFGERGANPVTGEVVDNYRRDGWQCPDAGKWPLWWSVQSKNGTVEFPASGGVGNDSYAQIASGKAGEVYLCGYHGYPLEERNYVYTIWARGKGKLLFHVLSYGKTEDGRAIQLVKADEVPPDKKVQVDSSQWVRYRHLMVKTPPLWQVHPWMGIQGKLDIDDVDIVPSTPALDLIVKAEEELYGTGALIENMDSVRADDTFKERVKLYRDALAAFGQKKNALDKKLAASVEEEISGLGPYVLSEGTSVVRVLYYNEMIALTRVLKNLSGKKAGAPVPIKATKATVKIDYQPGVRKIKQGTVMVIRIEPNKILYEEGEDVAAKITLKNATPTEQKVTLVAVQYTDMDNGREVARASLSLAAGEEKAWTISYNVGPETYGRALEIRIMDEAGKELDRLQEYYQAGKEWFRVQMHSGGRYNNMQHWFSAVPTAWGVHSTDAEIIIGEQGGSPISPRGIRDASRLWQTKGKNVTFYQNCHFSGIMGYEELRKYPEYALYDENGQLAVDPVYGGYPDPMVLASPIETGPKRKPTKPYLDRKYIVWMHCPSNFAMEDNIRYGARCIKEHAKESGFDGVFIDGTITVLAGCDYEGKRNIPEDREEVAKLNARMQDIYYNILKGENPYFGTWYNHSYRWPPIARLKDRYAYLGSGTEGDVNDEWIRKVFSRPNVACLIEMSVPFHSGGYEGLDRRPKELMDVLCNNRDYIVQRYAGNAIIGYVYPPISTALDKPGFSKWGWPTVNYYMALITAAQHHIVIADSWPSADPALQFQTRYSRFLWAPDIKVAAEAEKTVTVETPEELWWKRFVYRRETKEGYDLILHLVRIPPMTNRWDINWVEEPIPLEGVKITTEVGPAKILSAEACRPYHFEEEQQVVQNVLEAKMEGGKATFLIPPFRYHTMVVLQVTGR